MADRTVTTKYKADISDFVAKNEAMKKEVGGLSESLKSATRQSITAASAEMEAAKAARDAATAQGLAADAAQKARTAESEAAAARELSAEAAKSLADGGIEAAEAQKLEADAAQKAEKANLANAVAMKAESDAADSVERAYLKIAAAQLAAKEAAKESQSGFKSAIENLLPGGEGIAGISGSAITYGGAAVAAIAPMLSQAIGGAVTAGFAGAGIGAAIAGQINNPMVKGAWKQLGGDAKTELTDVTSSMAKPLAAAAGILDAALAGDEEKLRTFFESLAPYTNDLTKGVVGMINQIVDALPTIERGFGPVLSGLGKDLPETGKAVAAVLESLTSDGETTSRALDLTFESVDVALYSLAAGFKLLGFVAGGTFQILDTGAAIVNKYSGLMKTFGAITYFGAQEWQKYSGASDSAAQGTKTAADAQSRALSTTQALDNALTSLNNTLDDTFNNALATSNATLQYEDDLSSLVTKLKNTNGTLNDNTDAGRQNHEILNKVIADALAARDAYIQQHKAADGLAQATADANSTFNAQIDKLIQQAEAAGASKKQIDALLKSMGLIRDKDGHIRIIGVDTARAKTAALVAELAKLHDKKVSVETDYTTVDSSGRRPQQYGYGHADGAVVDYTKYAVGGFNDAAHIAQIAPAGAYRLWAEPETGGEAYIPLASSKRDRSLAIWEETGRRLGVNLLKSSAAAVAAPAASGPLTIENHIEVGGEVVRVVRTEIDENNRAIARGALAGTGMV